jgi:hypothetical protein
MRSIIRARRLPFATVDEPPVGSAATLARERDTVML